ncbi:MULTISPECIES: PHP domain-containing protein [unclassified Clostridium]|uniref:PHP domain-containing protein n=1 Tax=Clostridium sulfidigenes TaxID=318464 RepID=A0A927WAI6_9CLOT|nr:PHP domain-containing protein [Clostridium sulfidigenes]
MNIIAEFHCHTTASDGRFSPSQVVEMAKNKNVELLSITDHDTTEGISEALTKANEISLNFIPGIELSCNHNGESIHILGYFKGNDYKDETLIKFLNNLKRNRETRASSIVKNLDKYFNIKINVDDVLKISNGVIARPHIAQAIVNAGYPFDFQHIFDKFIGNDSPAYVPNKHISIPEGIELLKKYNCVVILAHPKLIKKTPIKNILNYDFHGIEALYYQNFKRETDEFISLAKSRDMIITCGSDFHGISKDDTKHGNIGDMFLSEEDFKKFMILYKK